MSEHDLSEFIAETSKHGPECSIAMAIETLTEDQVGNLAAAMSEGSIPGTAIAKVLSRWTDQKIGANAVRRHRKNECACG